MTAKKTVQVLVTYTFKHTNRVCFTVLASNGTDKYNTCFDNGNASCTCDGFSEYHKECYHVKQLRPRYDAIMAKRETARTREQALAAAQEASKDELARIEADLPVSKASSFETLKTRYDVRTSEHRQQAPLQRQGFSLFR